MHPQKHARASTSPTRAKSSDMSPESSVIPFWLTMVPISNSQKSLSTSPNITIFSTSATSLGHCSGQVWSSVAGWTVWRLTKNLVLFQSCEAYWDWLCNEVASKFAATIRENLLNPLRLEKTKARHWESSHSSNPFPWTFFLTSRWTAEVYPRVALVARQMGLSKNWAQTNRYGFLIGCWVPIFRTYPENTSSASTTYTESVQFCAHIIHFEDIQTSLGCDSKSGTPTSHGYPWFIIVLPTTEVTQVAFCGLLLAPFHQPERIGLYRPVSFVKLQGRHAATGGEIWELLWPKHHLFQLGGHDMYCTLCA